MNMIVSYKTGAEFLQDNQTYLQKNPYLSTFFTLDAPLLQEAGKINYALRCEQGETRLLALKVEPYNLLLFGEGDSLQRIFICCWLLCRHLSLCSVFPCAAKATCWHSPPKTST